MSDQDGKQATALPRPSPEDAEAWKAYWQAQGQPWRTLPEIDAKRREELAQCRQIVPTIEMGIYPFKGMKLSRADVEWLLAMHINGQRLADENDWRQPGPDGLDVRGADLRHVDLSALPLTRLRAGLKYHEWINANAQQRAMAVVRMEGADLHWTHLEGAYFCEAHLEGADLREAHLEGAHFREAHLEGALLRGAHLDGTSLHNTHVEGSDLRGAFFTSATNLLGICLSNGKFGTASLEGVRWNDVELSVVDWTQVKILGEERQARQRRGEDGEIKHVRLRLHEYRAAVRANRKLAVALQGQGLNEEAARFGYQAQKLQRVVLRYRKKFGQYLFSSFLDVLAGYGYRPGRSVLWYLATIVVFALGYHVFGHLSLWPPDAFVYSLTSFHGRGFFPGLEGKHSLHDPLIMFAAVEAVVGLIIEISFIATFTQRFFGK